MLLNRKNLFIASITLFLFIGLPALAQHSLELKKSVVFQQEPIDYYLQVDSAYFNTPHYVLWIDPVAQSIIDFNIHIPFAPVSKGSFFIEEDWKNFGQFILIAVPKAAHERITYAHLDIVPNTAELLDEWKNISVKDNATWEKVKYGEEGTSFQIAPKISQAPAIESAYLMAKLLDNNWEISTNLPEAIQNFTLEFSQNDSLLFEAKGTREQQSITIPTRRLPPGKLELKLMGDGAEMDILSIQNPLFTINESDINFQTINDSTANFQLNRLINPWVALNELSLKVSISDFPELLMNEAFTNELAFSFEGFEENTLAVFHSHKKNKPIADQRMVVFNRETELFFYSDPEGNYFFDQFDYALLDDDYHIVSHDFIQGDIEVNVTFPDLEKINKQLPQLLAQMPERTSLLKGKKQFNFNLESAGMLLDEVSITAKRKRSTISSDTREKPNSVHFRNIDYTCLYNVLNCAIHQPFFGHNSQYFNDPKVNIKRDPTKKALPLHLWATNDNPKPNQILIFYKLDHSWPSQIITYPNTFFEYIKAKAKIRNIQEHYFKDEAIFGFYSDMISQAYAPLSLLYTSEIELPGVYSNAYFIVEVIHQPTGMRQQVVKKIQ